MNIRTLINAIYRRYRQFFNQRLMNAHRKRVNPILGNGERYDPYLATLIGANAPCHIERYEFAKKYMSMQDSVLDIACGTGHGTARVSEVCKCAVGVDISPIAIKYAQKEYCKQNTKFIVSDFFSNNITADIVLSFETIEHLKVDTIQKVLDKLVLFSKKRIIGSVPYKEMRGSNPHHFLFNLNETHFQKLGSLGKVDFFYQTADGKIFHEKPEGFFIQNLIFMFQKKEGTT